MMHLNCLTGHIPFSRFTHRASFRMISTIVGKSGREYVQGEVLRPCNNYKFSIFKAKSGSESFVLKRVPRPIYDQSVHLAAEFAGTRRLRMHIDCNQEEGILVYPYFRGTLLSLIEKTTEIPFAERKKILLHTGEALRELHAKDWVHSDVTPDNIFVNWTHDKDDKIFVNDVALGDFDIAFKSDGGEPRHTAYPLGSIMWRSPEGQTGRNVTKASDMFSFGLVCLFTLGARELLLIHDWEKLRRNGISAEQEITVRHFCYFGPVPEALISQIDDSNWRAALRKASSISDRAVKKEPGLRFERWAHELDLEVQKMISGLTNLNPRARITTAQLMTHEWWQAGNLLQTY